MKRCRIILPRDSEGLEEAIRKGMEDSGVELVFRLGDVDSATVEDCEISQGATEGGQETATAALCHHVGQKIAGIEQRWRGES